MTVEAIFTEALAKATPAERTTYLDQACADDRALRLRVETLLASHEAEGRFLDKPAIECAAEELAAGTHSEDTQAEPSVDRDDIDLDFLAPSTKPGSLGRLGHYEIQDVVGRGGMGIVLRAFDEQLHRVVAIKVMAAQLATNATARRRFKREAQAAAAVCHDQVVTIHAVEEANGLPYLVMQYVSGMSLQERLDRNGRFELREIVRIGMQTAAGLAAAHAQGLIHRDIKPANILLENGVERVRITDFGLARAVADASLTQSGVVAGTPQYMSPEQARGDAVDQRTDLFSLGSVLYAMCTGRPPFRADSNMAVLKRVCEDTPSAIRATHPEIPDWLVAIIHKLHAKNPAERFQSAAEVAELLKDHLAHLQHPSVGGPVAGNPRSPSGRQAGREGALLPSPSGRGAGGEGTPRRRRWALAAAALLLCLIGGLGFTEVTGVTTLRATVIRIFTPEGTLIVEEAKATPPDQPLAPGEVRRFVGHTLPVHSIALSNDGSKVLSGGQDKILRLWDMATGKEIRRFEGHTHFIAGVALSPDGRRAVSTGAYTDRTIFLWDVETGRQLPFWDLHSGTAVVFSPDGRCILFNDLGNLRLCEVKTGKELRRFEGHTEECWSLAFSADGRSILSGSEDKTMRLWEVETGKELRRFAGHNAFVLSVAFSVDGRQALSGGADGTMRLWEVDSGKELRRFEVQDGEVQSVAFSPDGRYALSGSGVVRLWDVHTGKVLRRFTGHTSVIAKVAFTPDGRHALSAGWDGDNTLRLWQLPEPASAVEAFVLLGGKGVAERKFDSLAGAVQAASDGDTIEIRGNGPFTSDSVSLGKGALTIRAADGFRPVLKLTAEAVEKGLPLLETSAPLVLEGLELRQVSQKIRGGGLHCMLLSQEAPLWIANCRFFMKDQREMCVRALHCPIVELRNCEFFTNGTGLHWVVEESSKCLLSNCVQAGGVTLGVGSGRPGAREALAHLEHNTLVTSMWLVNLSVGGHSSPKFWGLAPEDRLVRIKAADNILDAKWTLAFLQYPETVPKELWNLVKGPEAEGAFRSILHWDDERNIFAPGTAAVYWGDIDPPHGPKGVSDWKKFWGNLKADAREGQVRYQGGNLSAKLADGPDKLTPEDFRLRPDSAGYKARKDSKDLGADVDLVGPGPAYERWRKTPAYQQWLKDSGQVKN